MKTTSPWIIRKTAILIILIISIFGIIKKENPPENEDEYDDFEYPLGI